MPKRTIAFALMLILVLTVCVSSFADYYPTVKFASGSKNKYVKYGDPYTLKVKCKQGSGPFGRTCSIYGNWILRAGMTVVATKGYQNRKLVDWDFYGNKTFKLKLYTDVEFDDPIWGIDEYTLTATSWYKPTTGFFVSGFRKYKSVRTKLYIYR